MHHHSPRRAGILLAAAALLLASAPALAGHPDPQDMQQIKRYAHTVENAATQLHRIAERRDRHAPRWALVALHRLEKKSAHFHQQVERYMAAPRHTERDFHELLAAYRRASRAEHAIRGGRRVSLLFSRLRSNMRRLTRAYSEKAFAYRRVMQLAHRIENRADHLHDRLERELSRGRLTRYERAAVRLVHRLDEAAEHLHAEVERRHSSAVHTRDDARRVVRLFESASRRLHRLHVSHHLLRDFEALGSSVDRLARIYGLRSRQHRSRTWRPRRHFVPVY